MPFWNDGTQWNSGAQWGGLPDGRYWQVDIDLDRTGNYAVDYSRITHTVISAAWTTGLGDSDDEIAQPARLTLTLDNSTGDFFPENTASPFYDLLDRRPLIRIRALHNSTTRTLYEGKIVSVQPTVGQAGDARCIITAEDPMLSLLDAEYTPALLEQVTTDAALTPIFAAPLVLYPYASDYWILDAVGAAELGTNTRLFGTLPTNFDTGNTTLAFVGDNLDRGAGVSAQGFIRDIVAAEAGGRFFFDPAARQFVFHNRQHDSLNPTPAATFTAADFTRAEYVSGRDLLNAVTIDFQPRVVGSPGSVLWSAGNLPLRLGPGETRRLTARYTDPASTERARVGGKAMIAPQASVDYVANQREDGSGRDRTKRLIITAEFGAARATLTLVNPTGRDLYITTLQLRGTPITSYETQTVSAVDAQSIADHDRRDRALSLPALDDAEFAQSCADVLVGRYKTPLARFRSVTLSVGADDACGNLTQALTRAVGDRITLTDAQTSHDRDYIIVGSRHVVQAGGVHPHDVTWLLRPAERTQYWRLSDGVTFTALSTLGDSTRLML